MNINSMLLVRSFDIKIVITPVDEDCKNFDHNRT